MLNIKEIALRVAQAINLHYIVTGEMHTNDDWNIRFAEALIAELAKQNKPVAELLSLFPGKTDSYIKARAIGVDPFNTWAFPHPGTKLYTVPPTAEQIANETAEAIAEYCRNQDHYCLATEIENGAWKAFK